MVNVRLVREEFTTELPCLCAALRRASRSVTVFYDLVLAPAGLRATQFLILHTLYDFGEVAQCDLARDHSVAVETLSRRLGGLRRKGYVTVRIGSRHRERLYSLTETGESIVIKALPYWQRAQDRLRLALDKQYRDSLISFCDQISKAAKDAEFLRTANHATFARTKPSFDVGQNHQEKARTIDF